MEKAGTIVGASIFMIGACCDNPLVALIMIAAGGAIGFLSYRISCISKSKAALKKWQVSRKRGELIETWVDCSLR